MSKVIFITGASSGIGAITATYLSEQGFVVYGTSRNPKAESRNFELIQLDVLDKLSIDAAVAQVIEKEGRLDVLINNAGIGITGPIEETPTEEMRKGFETNFFGGIEVIKSVLPQMRRQGDGLILNVTSIAGYMGLPFRGVYSATKGSMEILTEALSMEVKQFGIKVVNVAPGDFATNIASGRYHTPVFKGSAYAKLYQSNLDLMDAHVDSGKDPIIMAHRIHKIINDPNPKLHYKVGEYMQKFSIVLKRVLPDRMYEKLIMNHYKM
ncbi:SDR family oxidoreductase [Lutimonas halocynthiae]|uniref:SDR family oxidoreductase n=1 Tax=Lutimonas halocynthiae TaxID=1446477 RepID=UPI0025B57635|nr:SDR family oxidoreductase [Lutimonas halocynthiae]MDN3642337.1 SDR family oxidoreductase [Lutimonas halocynthiae]